ncbi:MAG: hypothetical protein Ct9H90mP6_10300 [Gammaproteobacteria bacterium]|nr:MAG: hypothetical protein Ct9H90mP6_10300 [Gammaproteobacteria bacterium]
MATGALHQALIKQRKRTKNKYYFSTGSARDTHQIACLIAFGANPRLSMGRIPNNLRPFVKKRIKKGSLFKIAQSIGKKIKKAY